VVVLLFDAAKLHIAWLNAGRSWPDKHGSLCPSAHDGRLDLQAPFEKKDRITIVSVIIIIIRTVVIGITITSAVAIMDIAITVVVLVVAIVILPHRSGAQSRSPTCACDGAGFVVVGYSPEPSDSRSIQTVALSWIACHYCHRQHTDSTGGGWPLVWRRLAPGLVTLGPWFGDAWPLVW
jgi:hypothetical protein